MNKVVSRRCDVASRLFVSRNAGGRWMYATRPGRHVPGRALKVMGRKHPDVFIVISMLEQRPGGCWAFVLSRLGPGWIWIDEGESCEVF